MQRHFFATPEDLIPVFEWVERKYSLAYTLTGLFQSPLLVTVFSGATIATLFDPAPHPSAVNGPTYLVTLSDAAVQVRDIPQNSGGNLYAVDQLFNADSITVQHGGLFGSDVLLSGRVATVSNTLFAMKTYRAFTYAIGRKFTRIQAFYVGLQAKALLQQGYRLTQAVQSPPEYDLLK